MTTATASTTPTQLPPSSNSNTQSSLLLTTAASASNNNSHQMNGNSKQNEPKHWSQKKHESILCTQSLDLSLFLSKLKGGSDNGQFVYLDTSFSSTSIKLLSGKLYPNEIILEIQGQKVSGYTLYDVHSWIKQLVATYPAITIRTVKSSTHIAGSNSSNMSSLSSTSSCSSNGSQSNQTSNLLILPLELRAYLDERFQKGSIDYDLQQTIRENVYMRTVPCTTRSARPGEVNGQDYIFLSNEQFLELEQAGDLLEYGVYNGHYYGTPKPPKSSTSALIQNSDNVNGMYKQNSYNHLMSNQVLEDDEEEEEDEDNSSNYKQEEKQMPPKRNNSISDMTSLLNLKKINNVNNSFEGKYFFFLGFFWFYLKCKCCLVD